MPIYEYDCQKCGHEFEEVQSFNDPPIQTCPECGNGNSKRKVSISAFHLKGGGWYKDGYGSPSAEQPDSKDSKNEKLDSLRG